MFIFLSLRQTFHLHPHTWSDLPPSEPLPPPPCCIYALSISPFCLICLYPNFFLFSPFVLFLFLSSNFSLYPLLPPILDLTSNTLRRKTRPTETRQITHTHTKGERTSQFPSLPLALFLCACVPSDLMKKMFDRVVIFFG